MIKILKETKKKIFFISSQKIKYCISPSIFCDYTQFGSTKIHPHAGIDRGVFREDIDGFISYIENQNVKEIVLTDVSKDGMISGINFLLTILLIRFLGMTEFGLFSLHLLNLCSFGSTKRPVQFIKNSYIYVFDIEIPSFAPASIKKPDL